jgi:hypothetical protein
MANPLRRNRSGCLPYYLIDYLIPSVVASSITNLGKKLWCGEEGQDLTEYALLLCLVVLTTAALVIPPMSSVNKIWVNGNSELTAASTATS